MRDIVIISMALLRGCPFVLAYSFLFITSDGLSQHGLDQASSVQMSGVVLEAKENISSLNFECLLGLLGPVVVYRSAKRSPQVHSKYCSRFSVLQSYTVCCHTSALRNIAARYPLALERRFMLCMYKKSGRVAEYQWTP